MVDFLENKYELVFQRQEGNIFLYHFPKRPTVLKKIDFWYFKVQVSKWTRIENFKILGFFDTNRSVGAKPQKGCANIIADSETFKLHSKILATWNFSTNHDIVPWIGDELHIRAEFQEFSRNDKYVRVPGKLSETHSKVPMFSNPGDKVLKCVKTRGQICPVI